MTDAETVWELLAEPSRRAIFMHLADRPSAVGELAAHLPISRPAVSQHLRVMKLAGLVTDEEQGTRRVYRLDPVAVTAFRDQLDAFWNRALSAYARSVTADAAVADAVAVADADAADPDTDATHPDTTHPDAEGNPT